MKYTRYLFNIKKTISVIFALITLIGCDNNEAVKNDVEVIRSLKISSISALNRDNIKYFPAKISANREVEASFQVPGRLNVFSIKPGDKVVKGQLLASVEDRDFQNELTLKQTDQRLASLNFKRIKRLYTKKVVSKAEYDQANAQLSATKANLRLSKDRVKDTKIYAPFSGQIAQTFVENFQYIQPQQAILSLHSTDILDVVVQIPESLVLHLGKNQTNTSYQPTVTLGSGKSALSYKASYKQHSTVVNAGTQSYEVVFSLPKPDHVTLYSGMAATVKVDFDQLTPNQSHAKDIQIPLTAVLTDDKTNRSQVWIFDPETQKVSPRTVKIGEISGQNINVSGDLSPTDLIATAGLNQLYDGMKVKPITREQGL